MRFAFSSNAFGRFSLLDTIGLLAEIGYEGIEIMADVPHAYPPDLTQKEINSIRRTLDRHRMEISNINAFMLRAIGGIHHPSWIEKDPLLRRQRIEHTKNCIELAERLGAQTISTEPGGPLDGMCPSEGIELFKDGLREVEELARCNNVRVLIEPEPDLLIETSAQFLDFYKDLAPDVFGLNFDIGHFFCVGEEPTVLIHQMKELICHFHIEDIARTRVHHHLIPGEGALDFHGIIRSIREIDYSGFVTVELYPYEDKPIEAARDALVYLERIRNDISHPPGLKTIPQGFSQPVHSATGPSCRVQRIDPR